MNTFLKSKNGEVPNWFTMALESNRKITNRKAIAR